MLSVRRCNAFGDRWITRYAVHSKKGAYTVKANAKRTVSMLRGQ